MMSSKPITDTSPGIRSPASRNARMAPIAEASLKANNALNSRPVANSFWP